ncbi:hypothetical protein SAY86_003736 [Trapa natans]|uniref:Uncharacterized protein n=1 Tax=Trapa natans TaxID=22666 RepID=A0AAN7MEH3_TRANT|nr:hypothetical protein SAY86_003736 [Trapa natans]
MDPNLKSHPVLSYVMSRLPSMGPRYAPPTPKGGAGADADAAGGSRPSDFVEINIHQHSDPSTSSSPPSQIVDQMPHLAHPQLFASMADVVSDVSQIRAVLRTLGDRPDHEAIDEARSKIAEIDSSLAKKLQEIMISPRPSDMDQLEWRSHLTEKENRCRKEANKEKDRYKAIISHEKLHDAYEMMVKEAEEKLVRMYERATVDSQSQADGGTEEVNEEANEEVVGVLRDGLGSEALERVDLSGKRLRILPEAFGKIQSLVVLNLSKNQLEALPDSVAGLENLEELNASSNLLVSLPDSIGLLQKLKYLNVSGNKLTSLPDSICHCKSLVELDVSFNNLTYLPTNIGHGMPYLKRLSIQLNKIRSLPTSICELSSLTHLDAHFNELRGLPHAIGYLTSLENLNLSSNFSDLIELPETFGDLMNLRELDLSNNQIHALPNTFGRLDNLVKLNLEHNPLVVPPPEILKGGAEAVKIFMSKRWLDILVETERKNMLEQQESTQTGWLTRSTSWLKDVSVSVSGYLSSPRAPMDPYLNQQL